MIPSHQVNLVGDADAGASKVDAVGCREAGLVLLAAEAGSADAELNASGDLGDGGDDAEAALSDAEVLVAGGDGVLCAGGGDEEGRDDGEELHFEDGFGVADG